MAAEPSRSEPPGPNRRSVATQPTVDAPITRSALGPKYQTAASTTGTRLPTTDHMIRGVLSGPLMWGAAVSSKRGVSITRPSPLPSRPLSAPRLRRPAACAAPSC